MRDVKRNGYKTRPRTRAWVRWAWRTPKSASNIVRTLYESSRATAGIWQRMLCSAWGDIFHDINRFENNCIRYTVMSAHAHCCEVLCCVFSCRFPESRCRRVRTSCAPVTAPRRRASRRMCPRMYMTCVTCVACVVCCRALGRRNAYLSQYAFLINGRHGMLPRRYPHGATAPARRTCRPTTLNPRPQHVHFSARRTIPVPFTRLHPAVILCEFTSAAPS